jgi:hypothetical protein
MKLIRIVPLFLLAFAASLLPLGAAEVPASAPTPAVQAVPAILSSQTITPAPEFRLAQECPILYYCPWYIDGGCTCDLIWCFDRWECGRPYDGWSSRALSNSTL